MVLCGSETWSLTLSEEHKLSVFENGVLRRIFGLKRDEMREGWKKLHKEELHNLHSLTSIFRMIKSRRLRWERHVAKTRKKTDECRILLGKPEGKRLL
jgi:hypothetical protein